MYTKNKKKSKEVDVTLRIINMNGEIIRKKSARHIPYERKWFKPSISLTTSPNKKEILIWAHSNNKKEGKEFKGWVTVLDKELDIIWQKDFKFNLSLPKKRISQSFWKLTNNSKVIFSPNINKFKSNEKIKFYAITKDASPISLELNP
ncbi:MAG: hypothetical protein AAF573_17350, partial [Bacteroidota bacterium]